MKISNRRIFQLLVVIAIVILIILVGSFIPHRISKNNNYVGKVGGHIYVDNSSNKNLPDLNTIWFIMYNGAPGYVLELGRLVTQRMEITDVKELGENCGGLDYNLYTFFNIKFLKTGAWIHCP